MDYLKGHWKASCSQCEQQEPDLLRDSTWIRVISGLEGIEDVMHKGHPIGAAEMHLLNLHTGFEDNASLLFRRRRLGRIGAAAGPAQRP